MLYTVGEASKRIGVAPSTLRYYDKEGLLPFVERSGSGIRMFKEEDFGWLAIIECLKHTGMSIKEIKIFIDWCVQGDSTIDQRLALIDRQREAVEEQMQQLKDTLHLLDYGIMKQHKKQELVRYMIPYRRITFRMNFKM